MSIIINIDKFTSKDFQEMGIAYGVQVTDNCPICLGLFTNSEAIVELGCQHIYCRDCFEDLPINLQANCSICRAATKPSRYFLKKFGILECDTPKTTKEILLEKIDDRYPHKIRDILDQLDPNSIEHQELIIVILKKMHFDYSVIDVLDDDLKNNPEFMLSVFIQSLQQEGALKAVATLYYVSDDLKNNEVFMTKVLKACPEEHALTLVGCIGRDLLRENGFKNQWYKKILGRGFSHHKNHNDKKVALKLLELISHREVAGFWKLYKLENSHLSNDKETALKFLEKCHPSDALEIFNYAGDKLKKDIDFKEACYKKAQTNEDSLIQVLTGYGISFNAITAYVQRYLPVFG